MQVQRLARSKVAERAPGRGVAGFVSQYCRPEIHGHAGDRLACNQTVRLLACNPLHGTGTRATDCRTPKCRADPHARYVEPLIRGRSLGVRRTTHFLDSVKGHAMKWVICRG